MKRLTIAQKVIYDFIVEFEDKHLYYPNNKEIAHAMNKSISLISYYLEQLERKGFINRPHHGIYYLVPQNAKI